MKAGPIKRTTIAQQIFDAATSMRVVDMNNFSLPKESQHFLLLTGLRHAAEWLQGRYTIVVQPLDLPVDDPTAEPRSWIRFLRHMLTQCRGDIGKAPSKGRLHRLVLFPLPPGASRPHASKAPWPQYAFNRLARETFEKHNCAGSIHRETQC